MSALQNQTSVNPLRYFFAQKEDGEQELFTTTQAAGALTDFYVGINGSSGNEVQINQMPDIIGTVTAGGEEMLYAGTASTYKTLSSLSGTATGISLSSDRTPGTGVATIESYASNGGLGGFELLSRGANSAVLSSINTSMNHYLSTIGHDGATVVIKPNGALLAGDSYVAPYFTSLNEQPGPGGRPCYGIQDLSGASGVQAQARWAMGTTGVPVGGNVGSDLAFFSYNDAGNFITSAMTMTRADGAVAIPNISSIQTTLGGTARGQVFPIIKDNTEFGAENDVAVIAGSTSNQALFGSTWAPLFSTPVASLNPNTQTLIAINWLNSLSSGNNFVTYKVGFSTATAYTNVLQTSYVPGLAASWTGSDLPSATTPVGATNLCAVCDPDGLSASGDGFLYVLGQLTDPNAAADQIYIAKGATSEPTRNAFTFKSI